MEPRDLHEARNVLMEGLRSVAPLAESGRYRIRTLHGALQFLSGYVGEVDPDLSASILKLCDTYKD